MKIFESNSIAKSDITGSAAKVLETGKGFLLNCQYYNKDLIPSPLETMYLLHNNNLIMTNKNMFLQSTGWRECQREFGIVYDNKNPDISYCIGINGDNENFLEFEEKNGTIICSSSTGYTNYEFRQEICQDDLYMYFIFSHISGSNYYSYLCRYNKKQKTFSNIYNYYVTAYSFPRYEVVHVDDEKIILFYFYNNNYYFLKHAKATGSNTVSSAIFRGQSSDTTQYSLSVKLTPSCVLDLGNNQTGIYAFNIANATEPIDMYIIDRDTFTPSMQHYTITWNSEVTKFNIDTGYSFQNRAYMWTAIHNGVRYLHVAFYNQNFENVSHAVYQGIYSFIIDDSSYNLTFTGYNNFSSTVQFHGLLFNESYQYGIIGFYNQFGIIEFNALNGRYEITDTIITEVQSVGLDQLERIWYMKTDKSVHMINLQDVQNVILNFEKKYYEYTGTSIHTYIEFEALNYLDEAFTGKFQLTISGPAIFIDNNSTVLEFDYAGIKQQIDILITGASPISIYPKFLSV